MTFLLSVTAASASECLDAINKYRGMGGKSDVAACADQYQQMAQQSAAYDIDNGNHASLNHFFTQLCPKPGPSGGSIDQNEGPPHTGQTCTWDDVVACWYYEGTSYSNECCKVASTTQHKDQLLADHVCAACGFATEGSKWMYTATFCNSNSKSPEIGGRGAHAFIGGDVNVQV